MDVWSRSIVQNKFAPSLVLLLLCWKVSFLSSKCMIRCIDIFASVMIFLHNEWEILLHFVENKNTGKKKRFLLLRGGKLRGGDTAGWRGDIMIRTSVFGWRTFP